jgi:hypothetical protein
MAKRETRRRARVVSYVPAGPLRFYDSWGALWTVTEHLADGADASLGAALRFECLAERRRKVLRPVPDEWDRLPPKELEFLCKKASELLA